MDPQENNNQTCATIESDAELFVQIYLHEEKFQYFHREVETSRTENC